MNKLLLGISLLMIFSCSDRINGFYYDKNFNQNSPDYIFISICQDSVYYLAHNDLIGEAKYKGTWFRRLDTLFFDIPKPCKTQESKLIEARNTRSKSTRIQCLLLRSCADTIPLEFDTLIINNHEIIPIDSTGYAFSKEKSIHKIEITSLFSDYFTKKAFYPSDSTSNDIKLYIGETDDWQYASYFLVNKKFLIDQKSLRIVYQKGDSTIISTHRYKRHGKCKEIGFSP